MCLYPCTLTSDLVSPVRSYVINTERSRESESSANGTERRLGPGERVTQRRSPDARDRYAYSISYGNPRGIKSADPLKKRKAV